jgi:hypothetical protein
MKFFERLGWLFGRKMRGNREYAGTQADRDLGGQITQYKWLQKKEVLDMQHDLEMLKLEKQKQMLMRSLGYEQDPEDVADPNSPDAMIQNILVKAFSSHNQTQMSPQGAGFDYWHTASMPQVQQMTLTDEQIMQIWERIPTQQKPMVKIATDQQIAQYIKSNYPQIDDDSTIRAINMLRRQ